MLAVSPAQSNTQSSANRCFFSVSYPSLRNLFLLYTAEGKMVWEAALTALLVCLSVRGADSTRAQVLHSKYHKRIYVYVVDVGGDDMP